METITPTDRPTAATRFPRGPASTRLELRAATAAVHERLHHLPAFAAIAEGRLGVAAYGRLLLALHDFHGSLAGAADAACAVLGADALRAAGARRRELLRADLEAVGASAPGGAEPIALGGARAVGCLYTILGSTLGGKLIHRQLDYLFAGAAGRRFFAGAPDDGARWRDFGIRLDAYGRGLDDLTGLVEGAHVAFRHFAACVERHS